jgi:hypothetical protein
LKDALFVFKNDYEIIAAVKMTALCISPGIEMEHHLSLG